MASERRPSPDEGTDAGAGTAHPRQIVVDPSLEFTCETRRIVKCLQQLDKLGEDDETASGSEDALPSMSLGVDIDWRNAAPLSYDVCLEMQGGLPLSSPWGERKQYKQSLVREMQGQ